VSFRGSMQSCLSTSPGWGGLCIFMVTSMVVLVVYAIYILPDTSERYSPVAAYGHGPRALSGAAELVKIQAGQVHIARAGRDVQAAEDESEPVSLFRLNSRLGTSSEEPLDSLCRNPLITTSISVTCMVTGRNLPDDIAHEC
jgi:hypothetical protein